MATDSIESNFVSMKPAVEFIDIVDQYSYNEDLECTFKFNDYTPQEGDRVAIFKLGWTLVKDYVVFEWAPIDTMVKVHSVIFNKHILPKNNTEIYQVCYISGENVLHGASSSFQFSASLSPVMNKSIMCLSLSEDMVDSTRKPNDSDEELRKLKEENDMLRAALKAITMQTGEGGVVRDYCKDINELRSITDSLKVSLMAQQKEIDTLKTKIIEGGEEYRKLYLEKVKFEKKYDKLKGKINDDGKPVSSIVNFDFGELKSIPPFPFAKPEVL